MTAERTKIEQSLLKSKQIYERQINCYEEQIEKYKTEIDKLTAELKSLNTEFENYKIRAHSVLQKKRRNSEPDANNLLAEKEEIQLQLNNAQLKIQQLV